MSDEDDTLDPEVERDLMLRAVTERERRSSYSETSRWRPPAIVGQWRCRNPKCQRMVDVPEDGMTALAAWNVILRKRGEEPLDHDQVMFCTTCRPLYVKVEAERRRARNARIGTALRELRETDDPSRQAELLDELEELGHEDVDGLRRSLSERARSASARRPRREL